MTQLLLRNYWDITNSLVLWRGCIPRNYHPRPGGSETQLWGPFCDHAGGCAQLQNLATGGSLHGQ